jgi:type II secretory pathway component PulF
MVAVGERTGRLDSILEHVARFYAREVEMKTASLVALIEPALIIIVGIGVAIFVAAVLLPIYSLTSQG